MLNKRAMNHIFIKIKPRLLPKTTEFKEKKKAANNKIGLSIKEGGVQRMAITVNNVTLLDKPIKAEIRAISEKEDGTKYLIMYAEFPKEELFSSHVTKSLYLALALDVEAESMLDELMRNQREAETPCLMGIAQGPRRAKKAQPQQTSMGDENKENT
jgi:hypothetical protein